jgi:hypothetical protein
VRACRCGAELESRKQYCPDCRAANDLARHRRYNSKRPGAVERAYLVDECCAAHMEARTALFDKYGREVALRKAPWMRSQRCPQHAQDAQLDRERELGARTKSGPAGEDGTTKVRPRVMFADDVWRGMHAETMTRGRGIRESNRIRKGR